MDATLIASQLVNGLQLGLLLFLVAAGLTLTLGVLDYVNLAHGAFYMLGAFFSASLLELTGDWPLSVLLALPLLGLTGLITERLVARPLYGKSHLAQVLASFGLLLVIGALAMLIWGAEGRAIALPHALRGQARLFGVVLPVYRLVIIAAALAVAALLYVLLHHSRFGVRVRAAAANPRVAQALGIDTHRLHAMLFALGAMLAGLAGALIAPITEASLAMGAQVIIIAFVIIVIGGIGSLRGAFVAALLAGLIDTFGRAFLDTLLARVLPLEAAETAAPALSAMSIYILMALVLIARPRGLFPPPARGGAA
ncbi:MAG TPA: branched-chain amino acid ABC transporter permease [Thermopetrobacter sp.]|nr:branched-chain amino acid ABC transporter permease [Thermopetrobacter sp.]